MELHQFIKKKRELEQDLTQLIKTRIRRFEAATGYSPRDVTVLMAPATESAPNSNPQYQVQSVMVDVPVE